MSGGTRGWVQRLLPGNHSQSDDCVDNADEGGVKTVTYTENGVSPCEILGTHPQAQQEVAIRSSRNKKFFIHLIAKPGPNLDVGRGHRANIGFNTGRSSTHNKHFDLQVTNPNAQSGSMEIEIWETGRRVGGLTTSRFQRLRTDRGTLEIEVDIS